MEAQWNDPAALAQRFAPAVYRLAFARTGSRTDAEDVMQEVFCKRLYRAPKFRSPEHERNWLFQVALNLCRDEWRRHRRSELPLEAAVNVPLPPAELSLLEQAAGLPEKQRTALHLYYYEGYAVDEVGEIMGLNPSTVQTRLARGREKLKKMLTEE